MRLRITRPPCEIEFCSPRNWVQRNACDAFRIARRSALKPRTTWPHLAPLGPASPRLTPPRHTRPTGAPRFFPFHRILLPRISSLAAEADGVPQLVLGAPIGREVAPTLPPSQITLTDCCATLSEEGQKVTEGSFGFFSTPMTAADFKGKLA